MNKKLRVLELFAGVGTQAMALKRLAKDYENFDFEVVGISEIDKFAVQSYNAIHGETTNFGDVTLINPQELPDIDLVTYSFPCQDISVAGHQRGLAKNGGTRSSLLWECEKIIEAKRPKYLLMENVKNLISKKFKPHFEEWIEVLNKLGYTSYYACLNSKNFGIPQNRERVFMVSVLGEHKPYEFPKGFELDKTIKDMLEEKVEDRYYLSKENHDRFKNTFDNNTNKSSKDIIVLGNTSPSGYGAAKVLSVKGISCTVMEGHGRGIQILETDEAKLSNSYKSNLEEQCIVHIPQGTKKGYIEMELPGIADLSYPSSKIRRGRVQGNGDICPTLLAGSQGLYYFEKDKLDNNISDLDIKVRKLTELEMWRLMGISDEDFYKAKNAGISNTQLSKQAGNAIVVDVLYYIFKEMFI